MSHPVMVNNFNEKKLAEQIERNMDISNKLSPIAKYTKLLNSNLKKKQQPMKRKFSIMYSSLESNSKKNLLVEKNYEEKNYQKNFIVSNTFPQVHNHNFMMCQSSTTNFIPPFKIPRNITPL
ncbi:Hypothetical protein SRAE_1000097600 [Strongyloides ratti]|uniref:Uncharacterized protein n=1 Tax=Strongyloides ratti TaxID=34506 RepID=A0A090KZ81_STRRB|nr:Hypothetical protein SRAE_1000097600 [Strongyloides ratti]CEF62706.1 Hypothetical protein SRAE_1000097600 [Strongyloides ratti]